MIFVSDALPYLSHLQFCDRRSEGASRAFVRAGKFLIDLDPLADGFLHLRRGLGGLGGHLLLAAPLGVPLVRLHVPENLAAAALVSSLRCLLGLMLGEHIFLHMLAALIETFHKCNFFERPGRALAKVHSCRILSPPAFDGRSDDPVVNESL